ncbi:hypothetical protein [Promicromonospora soli]|nr:hypothetical protein [Promicromonospora soli]
MTSAIDGGPGLHIDPATLLPVLEDEGAFRAAAATDRALEVLVALWSGDPDRAAVLLAPLIGADPTSWRLQALAADVIRPVGRDRVRDAGGLRCPRGRRWRALAVFRPCEQELRRKRLAPSVWASVRDTGRQQCLPR